MQKQSDVKSESSTPTQQQLSVPPEQLDEAYCEAHAFYRICIYCHRAWPFVTTGEQTLYCPECGEKVTLYKPAS